MHITVDLGFNLSRKTWSLGRNRDNRLCLLPKLLVVSGVPPPAEHLKPVGNSCHVHHPSVVNSKPGPLSPDLYFQNSTAVSDTVEKFKSPTSNWSWMLNESYVQLCHLAFC